MHRPVRVLVVCVVFATAPTVSHANPFGRVMKSIKFQKGTPSQASPTPGPAAAPSPGAPGPQAAPAAPPAAATPPAVAVQPTSPAPTSATGTLGQGAGHPHCQRPVSGTAGFTPADHAALRKITTTVSSVAKVDLNGDGKPDFVVVDSENCGTAGCQTDVYASQGDAYVAVFSTEYMSEVDTLGPGTTNGMCDLVSDGIRYTWNGKTYSSQGPVAKGKSPAAVTPAQPSKPLSSYAGKAGFSDILLGEPLLAKEFQKLVGDRYDDFIMHFAISDNAVLEQGYLIGDGCQAHECDSEFAVGAVRLDDHSLYAAILSPTTGPKFKIFASRKGELPKPMKARMEYILKQHALRPAPAK